MKLVLDNLVRQQTLRVIALWIIRFLYRFGFVIGWTLIVTLFVSRYNIQALPYLFVANALLIMLGSAFFSSLILKLKKSVSLVATVFSTGVILFLATFNVENYILFFALLLFAEAFLMYQLNLILENFTEGMFSYLESEKKFPLLESADTIGGFMAGTLIFAVANSIETHKFIYLWIASIFLMVPIFLSFSRLKIELNLNLEAKSVQHAKFSERVHKFLDKIARYSFYKILLGLVFCYWMAINLVEYQFTSAVYQSVDQSVPHEGSGFEHALIHDLGSLNILFYGAILGVQALLGGRLISSFGIVGSMLIYPIVMLLSVLALFFNFNFITAVLAKNNILISGIIFKNAYLSSYYVMREKIRIQMREFLEGFIHPLGAISATAVLLMVQFFTVPELVYKQINYLLAVVFLATLIMVLKLRRAYLHMAMLEFKTGQTEEEKIVATEIIAQEGMKNGVRYLLEQLEHPKLHINIKLKILDLLRHKEWRNYILPSMMHLLEKGEARIQHQILHIMSRFDFSKDIDQDQIFTYHRLVTLLEKIFLKEKRFKVQFLILKILVKFKNFAVVDFLLKVLKTSKNPHVLSGCVALCRTFKDISLLHYLRKLMQHRSPLVKFQAILSAWDFPDLPREKESAQISQVLSGSSNTLKQQALNALLISNEQAINHFSVELLSLLNSKNHKIRFYAALCLARISHESSLNILLEDLFLDTQHFTEILKDHLESLPKKFRKVLLKDVNRRISQHLLELADAYHDGKNTILKESVEKMKDLLLIFKEEGEAKEIIEIVEQNLKKRYSI